MSEEVSSMKIMPELSLLSLSNVSWDLNVFIHIWKESGCGRENVSLLL